MTIPQKTPLASNIEDIMNTFIVSLTVALALSALPTLAQDTGPVTATIEGGTQRPSGGGQAANSVQNGSLDLTGGVRRPRNADEQFITAASNEFPETALARPTPDLNRTILQGTVMQATLETAIQSDLPGVIRAITSSDVRSYDGSVVLIPKGSRLFGTYRADLKINQSRALILWTRVVTPDGLSIMIGSRGTDRLGRAGQTGFVDTYFDERFGSAALISLIGAAPTVIADSIDNEDDVTEDVLQSLGGDFESATDDVVAEYLSIRPTIYIDQGAVINVLTERDIIFPFF